MASGNTTRVLREHRSRGAVEMPRIVQSGIGPSRIGQSRIARHRLGGAGFVVAGLAVWLASNPARAQQRLLIDQFLTPDIAGDAGAPGVTVLSRVRPEYAYQGVRAGSFVIRPELQETFGYSTNATGTNRARGSVLNETNATVQALSDWSRHSLGVAFQVDDVRYYDEKQQSYTNWTASVGGTYDIGRDTVSLGFAHQNLNQTPRDLDTAQIDQSITYRVTSVRGGYRAVFNRLAVRPELDVSNYDYDNGTAAGVPYIQSYRNRVVVSPSVTAQYELAPRRNLVFVVRDASASYSNNLPGIGRRDYNDISVLAGVDLDASGSLRYRILAGYQVRLFSSSQYKTLQSPVLEAAAIWTPTGLTTVTGSVARRIQDSADESTAGFTGTGLQLTVDHEYLRNVLLNANAGFALNEYDQGQGKQTRYTTGAGVTWLLNRNMRLGATYDFTARQSDATGTLTQGQRFGGNYTESRYLLQLRLGL